MTKKLAFLLFSLMFAAFSMKKIQRIKFTVQVKTENGEGDLLERRKKKSILFPNDSSVKLFRSEGTDRISWEDPQELVPIDIKSSIASSLRMENKADGADYLFASISNWFPSSKTRIFVKELVNFTFEFVNVKKTNHHNQTPLMVAA
jgi:hypothetical protein